MSFPEVDYYDFTEYNFTSTIDHFNNSEYNETEFDIRYWVNDMYFNPVNGSVFLYLCGEWTCSPPYQEYPIQVAA